MASVRSTIELVITGATRGLAAASAEAEAMAERIEAAEDKVSAARTRSADAEERVGAAEQRLSSARAGQEAALSRIGVAETNLERARDNSNGATTRLAQAQADLDAVRNRSGATADEVARAETRVNQVRTESDRAAAELQRAEAQLETARANAARSSSSVADAEAAIHRARSDAVRASEDLARSENDLNAVRRRGARDADNERSGILGLFDAFGQLRDAVTGADDAANRFLSVGSALQNVFSQIGGPIVQAVLGIAQFAAAVGAAVEIVGVLGGLIGQVLGGAVPILLALVAAAGAAALGMDGIKKAAEVMQPAFDKLKQAVSDVFVKALTPAFRDLAAALPKLTGGFQDVAGSISIIAQDVIKFVTSALGISQINTILDGTASLLQRMSPGITSLVEGLLSAGTVGAQAMGELGTAIGSVFDKIGTTLDQLGADGAIQGALKGLSATITGLGDVIGPIINLLVRMGAALGDSVGVALTDVGAGIEHVTPFFVKLADVAGKILVDAFNQLGPPLRELVDSILPGAGQGLDGLASVMHNVVLPAIAGFINFLRTDAIPGLVAFTQGAIIQFTSFASGVLSALSGILSALHGFFAAMALIPGPLQESFAKAAAVTDAFRGTVDGLKTSIDGVHDKTVTMTAKAQGADQIKGIQTTIDGLHDKIVGVTAQQHGAERIQEIQGLLDGLHDKVVTTTANVPSGPIVGHEGNALLLDSINAVPNKSVTTTGNVPGGPLLGTQGNNLLTGAVGAVPNKNVTTTGNVPSGPTTGTQGNNTLTDAISRVVSKTVQVVANVLGLDQVTNLIGAIGRVVGKTVNIVANVIGAGASLLGFASGGRVPTSGTFLVGENGPELLSLDALGAIVTPAARTRQILADRRTQQVQATPFTTAAPAAADQPITVNVMLSQDQIAGIAQVEIARRDRATKRTVLAGSGVTF